MQNRLNHREVMPKNFFHEFQPSDKESWRKQMAKETGQAGVSGKYILDGSVEIDAYLTTEELDKAEALAIQNSQRKTANWLNLTRVVFLDPTKTNSAIQDALKRGADGIILSSTGNQLSKQSFPKLLNSIRLSDTPVFFETSQEPNALFDLISRGSGYYLKGGIAFDPIANWMRTGENFSPYFSGIIQLLKTTRAMREFRSFMVEGHVYHRAGATSVQELALMVAALVSYADSLTDAGISPILALTRCFLSVSIGPDYIAGIAKIRALRHLHKKVCFYYQIPEELCNAYIHGETSSFYDTRIVPHNNLIRSTIEAMSAVSGGCDAFTIQPYDHFLGRSEEFSERIARNVSLVISNETYLNQVSDPAAGSYFIETLTMEMADAAWKLFLEIEEGGGIVQSFEKGVIQKIINVAWDNKVNALQKGKVIVGVNKFRSVAEKADEGSDSHLPKNDFDQFPQLLSDRNLSDVWRG